jgi:hypothetical protein
MPLGAIIHPGHVHDKSEYWNTVDFRLDGYAGPHLRQGLWIDGFGRGAMPAATRRRPMPGREHCVTRQDDPRVFKRITQRGPPGRCDRASRTISVSGRTATLFVQRTNPSPAF